MNPDGESEDLQALLVPLPETSIIGSSIKSMQDLLHLIRHTASEASLRGPPSTPRLRHCLCCGHRIIASSSDLDEEVTSSSCGAACGHILRGLRALSTKGIMPCPTGQQDLFTRGDTTTHTQQLFTPVDILRWQLLLLPVSPEISLRCREATGTTPAADVVRADDITAAAVALAGLLGIQTVWGSPTPCGGAAFSGSMYNSAGERGSDTLVAMPMCEGGAHQEPQQQQQQLHQPAQGSSSSSARKVLPPPRVISPMVSCAWRAAGLLPTLSSCASSAPRVNAPPPDDDVASSAKTCCFIVLWQGLSVAGVAAFSITERSRAQLLGLAVMEPSAGGAAQLDDESARGAASGGQDNGGDSEPRWSDLLEDEVYEEPTEGRCQLLMRVLEWCLASVGITGLVAVPGGAKLVLPSSPGVNATPVGDRDPRVASEDLSAGSRMQVFESGSSQQVG